MKKSILKNIAVIAIAILTTFGAASCKKDSQNNLSGTSWRFNTNWQQGDDGSNIPVTFNSDKTITITQRVSGSSWSQSGNSVNISIPGTTDDGQSTVVTFNGALNGNSMSGTMSNTFTDTGTFSATKQ